MTFTLSESLESRMKGYEKVAQHQFSPRNTIVVRVDGVAFHTFTKKADKPFDGRVSWTMTQATISTMASIQGCVLSYTQSDEATFLLTDLQGPNTEGWFGFKQSKLESVIASMFTYNFNDVLRAVAPQLPLKPNGEFAPAIFDARAFSVPLEDSPNVFVWRQKDAYKNFINTVARTEFGHSAVQGKSLRELTELLTSKFHGTPPAMRYAPHHVFGTAFSGSPYVAHTDYLGYEGFEELIVE